MDPRDHQRATGNRMTGPLDALDALAQRGIAGATSLFVQSVDLNDIIRRVDLNAVLDQVDVNRLLARVDVNALLARVDVDALLARADLDALLERVDLSALITRSSAGVASDTVNEVWEEAKELGDSADRWTDRLFHRDPEDEHPPAGD